MKLWSKGEKTNLLIEEFTVGRDAEMDTYLAEFDVLGSIAHVIMLESIGLLEKNELPKIKEELKNIYAEIKDNNFEIEEGVEDIHSQIELLLTRRLGELGKKIHSGRSRNDQVLLDLKMFTREELKKLVSNVRMLFEVILKQSSRYKSVIMPGYTHMQVAMPSSFGLWFGAYAESLADDLLLVQAAYRLANQNPLGSAAGYGSSFPLNRKMTTELLGFETLSYNSIYAQMGRGKVEKSVLFAISSIAATLSKMAMDVCLYTGENFGFIALPEELTTGSSIMPHKKNPDVFELLRSRCNKMQSLPNQITLMINNLPSGYSRDLQLVKELYIPTFKEINDCIDIASFALENISVKEGISNDKRYDYMYSVEEVNRKVQKGTPFRDAYRSVGRSIADGEFMPDKDIVHCHEGSIGNLCLEEIKEKMERACTEFNFEVYEAAFKKLLAE